MEDRQKWLDSLQVGDKAAMDVGGYGFQNYIIVKITKITPTRRMETSNGYKLDNKGFEMGKKDNWSARNKIVPITDKITRDIKKKKYVSKLKTVEFNDLTVEQLEKIAQIIDTEESNEKRDNQ